MNQVSDTHRKRSAVSEGCPDTVFILGIGPRSGTNFLHGLLLRHPAVCGVQALNEDFFLANAHHLERFARACATQWLPEWGCIETHRQLLGRSLGGALASHLHSLVTPPPEHCDDSDREDPTRFNDRRVVVGKTPSVQNLDLLHMFPGVEPIVLVRDGRSQVESAMRSFGWQFRSSSKAWARAARTVLQARERSPELLVLRYEDLVEDPVAQLAKVFRRVGLDIADCDEDALLNLPVIGSSEFYSPGKGIDWQRRESPHGFGSTRRHKTWTRLKHYRFNRIAGVEMQALGYELEGGSTTRWWQR